MVIRDIRIRIRTNPIRFHPLLLLLGLLLFAGFQVEATVSVNLVENDVNV